MNFKDISATYENGDKLMLKLVPCNLAGYQLSNVWHLFYAEKISDDVKGLSVIQPEYFPEKNSDHARQAFNQRLTFSNPQLESGLGYNLNDILVKKELAKMDRIIQATSDYLEDDAFHERAY